MVVRKTVRPRHVNRRQFERLRNSRRFLRWLEEKATDNSVTQEVLFEQYLVEQGMTFDEFRTPIPVGVPPENTVLPVITGDEVENSTLTVTPGTWINGDPVPTYTYTWLVNGVASGSTGTTYTLGASDIGANISVRETASSTAGTFHATSAETGAIAVAPTIPTLPHAPTLRFHPVHSAVTLDGSNRVTAATDLAGTQDADLPAGNEGPLEYTDAAGNKCWRFDGAQMLNIGTAFAAEMRDVTTIAVMRDAQINFTNHVFSLGSFEAGTQLNTQNSALYHRVVSGELRSIACGDERSGNRSTPGILAPGCQLHVAAATSNTTAVTLQMNSNQGTDNQLTFNSGPQTGAEIGRYAFNQIEGDFDLYELVVYSPALTPAQMDEVVTKLMTDHGIVDFTDNFILEGDSIMAGTTVTYGVYSPGMIISEPGAGYLASTWRVSMMAASGDGIADLLTDRDAGQMYYEDSLVGGDDVVIFEIGRNDLSSRSVTDEYNDVVAYINTATTGLLQRGCKVRVMANIGSGSAYTTAFQQFRALLIDPQFLVDCDAGPGGTYDGNVTVIQSYLIEDGGAGATPFNDPVDTSYFAGDSTHPTYAGAVVRVSGGDTPQYGMTAGLT